MTDYEENPDKEINRDDFEEQEKQRALDNEFRELMISNLSGFKYIKTHKKYAMTKLNLSEKGLKELNRRISEYIWLEEIDLSTNEFEEMKYHFEIIFGLRHLNLSTNKLTDLVLPDPKIDSLLLEQLQYYKWEGKLGDLKYPAEAKDIKEGDPSKQDKLEELLVGHSKKEIKVLTADHEKLLMDMVALNQDLKSFPDDPKLDCLQYLELQGNQLTNIPSLKAMPKLLVLNLSQNKIEEVKGFKGHPTLTKLILHTNELKHLDGIYNLPNLQYLDVSRNQLEYFGIFEGHFKTLVRTQNLKVFKISNNPLSRQVLECYWFNGLQYLEMKECEGDVESMLIFFLYNRKNLMSLKEAFIDVKALDAHAAGQDKKDDEEFEEIEPLFAEENDPDLTKDFSPSMLLVLLLMPHLETLNNVQVSNKLKRKAYILSEKFANDYKTKLENAAFGKKEVLEEDN